MSIITSAVQYILDLGASAMLPIILTIFGLILGQGFVKSFRAGLTVGVGFIGINLVIGLISSYAGAAAQAMVDRFELKSECTGRRLAGSSFYYMGYTNCSNADSAPVYRQYDHVST